MKERAHISKKNIFYSIIVIISVTIGAIVYANYNYEDFTKGVREKGKTSFSRDAKVKYSSAKSYKIENKEYNYAMFYQNLELKPNTPYKVSCKVKTENVENEKGIYTGGAQIAIKDTTECSKSITGTTDWTTLTFMFNSKNRTNVEIGFILGGYMEKCKGTAWFSDFKIEEGNLDTSKQWNIAFFFLQNIDVTVNLNNKPTNVKISMEDDDVLSMEADIRRLPDTIKRVSGNRITFNCENIKLTTPLKTISYDEENGYYIDPADIKDLIKDYVDKKEYDYIYVITRLGKLNKDKDVLVSDWIGLGGMDYYGIGFSNIRLPNKASDYIYKYDSRVNTFPEEVFVHEFLHTLERNEKEYGNENIANLHDHEKYGYTMKELQGLEEWYTAYMQNTINNANGTKAGLTENIYTSKPAHNSDFKYSYELNELKEPLNLIEKINSLVNRIKRLFKRT